MKLVAQRINSQDKDSVNRPAQAPRLYRPAAKGAEKQHAKNEILGDMPCLSDQAVQRDDFLSRNAGEKEIQQRLNEARRVL